MALSANDAIGVDTAIPASWAIQIDSTFLDHPFDHPFDGAEA